MKQHLSNLGQWAFTHRWTVIIAWLVILVATGGLAAIYAKPMTTTLSIPGVEAQLTMERFNEVFPDAGTSSGRIVLQATDGTSLSDHADTIADIQRQATELPDVTDALYDAQHTVSEDGTIGFVNVQLSTAGPEPSAEVIDGANRIAESARSETLNVEVGGDLVSDNPGNILGIGEVIGVIVAIGVLLATFGAIVAAGMPIIAALVTVGTSMAALFSLSHVLDINTTTPALAVMLGLAVGIDYSLFIINRYRKFLRDGEKPLQAAGHTIATAGNAVLFAATTVVIALAALAVVNIPFMTTMGFTAAATVALAAVVAVTLVPALLGLAGKRIFSRSQQRAITDKSYVRSRDPDSLWYRWGNGLLRFRLPILVASLALIGLMAWPAIDLQLGLPTDETSAHDSSRYKAAQLLREGFGAGYNGPLLILAEDLPAVTDADREAVRAGIMAEVQERMADERAAAEQQFITAMRQATSEQERLVLQQQAAAAAIAGEQQVAEAMATVNQQVEQYAPYYQANQLAERIAKLDGVHTAQPVIVNDDGTSAAIQVAPTTGPNDEHTSELVSTLRSESTQRELTDNGTSLAVTGSTAMRNDINDRLSAAMPLYLSVVIGLSLILLLVAFRSIVIPLKATLGFLLSLAAMLGALVAVFQWGWFGIAEAPGPIVSFLPIIGVGILFGLAMDYEFFLVSSMREVYEKTKKSRTAIIDGFAIGSRVVLAAGLIMVSVFAGFVTSHDNTIQALGFALAIGILIDALVVRMTIVPIVMSYLGDKAWSIPSWLDKILPKISID